MSEPDPASKIQKIADFVKAHKNCSVQVTAYADKATGTPELNMQYSKERAEKVVAALVKAGVSRSVITSEYKGDNVQPFALSLIHIYPVDGILRQFHFVHAVHV